VTLLACREILGKIEGRVCAGWWKKGVLGKTVGNGPEKPPHCQQLLATVQPAAVSLADRQIEFQPEFISFSFVFYVFLSLSSSASQTTDSCESKCKTKNTKKKK